MYCGFLFREGGGTKPRCASRRSITSTIPRQATSPPTLPHSSLHLHTRFDFQPKQTAQTAGSRSRRSHGDGAQGHSVGLDDLDQRGRTKKSIQSPAERFWTQSFSAGHWRLNTRGKKEEKKKKRNRRRARLIASNQPSDIYTSCHSEEPCRNKEAACQGWMGAVIGV